MCFDSFFYYGTDDLYLNYLARFLKPGGLLGVAGARLMQESVCYQHSAAWWRGQWKRTGIMKPRS
jgi:hypothetical protein